jgi:hypothetical protein
MGYYICDCGKGHKELRECKKKRYILTEDDRREQKALENDIYNQRTPNGRMIR